MRRPHTLTLARLFGIRIGAVYRGKTVIVPRGNTQIQAHDRVIMFVRADRVRKVEQMFRVSLEFF